MDAQTKTGTILDRIVEGRRDAIAHRKRVLPLAVLRLAVEKDKKSAPPRDFVGALARPGLNVVAELKKASPSRGLFREDFQPAALAAELERAGAVALSVLTEEEFFHGSLEYVKQARAQTSLPVLRKDFLFDPWQIWEARAAGADSFLLIAVILEDRALADLVELGRALGMEPLVEVHAPEELARALRAGARIVGVNNRDLRTFEEHISTSLGLIEAIPDDCIAVSESGLHSRGDLEKLRAAGFDGFLIGEHLMQAREPAAALRDLLGK